MMNKLIYLSCLLVILGACTIMPARNNTTWQAQRDWQYFETSGRLSVKINDKGSYAHFDWTQQNGVETININTPLGTTMGQLCQDNEGVLALDNKNQLYLAQTAEDLSQQLLGYVLPIQYLAIWANGEWVRNIPYQVDADGTLNQLGWQIARQADAMGLPKVLTLSNHEMTLKMVFGTSERQIGQIQKREHCQARGA